MVDAESYNKILSSKRRIIENKRRKKLELKNIALLMEKEKHAPPSISPDFGVSNSNQSLFDPAPLLAPQLSHPVADYEWNSSSKVAREPVNTSKYAREETSRALDETEQKSTVISCYDKPQKNPSGDSGFGIDPDFMMQDSPNIESPGSMEINDDSNTSKMQNDVCLIDQLFAENERECNEEIGDSLRDH